MDRGRHVDLMSRNEQYMSLIRTFLNEENKNKFDQSSDQHGSTTQIVVSVFPFSCDLQCRELVHNKFLL